MSFQAMAWAIRQEAGDPASRLLLLILANYADEQGKAWPSMGRLEKDTGMSRSSVIRKLAWLEAEGYLTRQLQHHPDGSFGHNVYTLGGSVSVTPPPVSQGHHPSVRVTPKPINEPIKDPLPSASGKARALDEAWQPDEALLAWALAAFPNVSVPDELETFRSHYLANGKAFVRWDHAFRNWLRKTAAFAQQRTPARPTKLAGTALDEHNLQSVRQQLDRLHRPRPPSSNRLLG